MILDPLLILSNELMFVFLSVYLALYTLVFSSHEQEQ
jgi:hypothetical protein